MQYVKSELRFEHNSRSEAANHRTVWPAPVPGLARYTDSLVVHTVSKVASSPCRLLFVVFNDFFILTYKMQSQNCCKNIARKICYLTGPE